MASVVIFPKPNSRWSAVTRVKPSTSAVAAKTPEFGDLLKMNFRIILSYPLDLCVADFNP